MVYISASGIVRYRRKSEVDAGTKNTFAAKDIMGALASATLPDIKQEIIDVPNVGSGREKVYTTVKGKIDLDGSLPLIPIEPKHLRYVFGKAIVTGTDGTSKTATYTPINSPHLPGLELDCVLKDTPAMRRIFRGVVMKSAEFSCEESGLFTADIGLQAFDSVHFGATDGTNPPYADISSTDIASPATPIAFSDSLFPFTTAGGSDPRPYIFGDVQITMSTGAVVFNNCKSAKIGIDNNVLSQHYLSRVSNRKPGDIIAQRPAFTAEAVIFPEDRRIIDELHYSNAVFDLVMAMTQSVTGGNLVTTITAKDCFIEEAPHSLPEDGAPVETTVTLHPRSITMVITDDRTTGSTTASYDIVAGDLVSINNP